MRLGLAMLTVAPALVVSALFGAAVARGQAPPSALGTAPTLAPTLLDRVVVRWHAPETGGVARPQFIFQRELAFEARLESLADPDPEPGPYRDRHLRAALDRRIAETLLASLPTLPPPTPKEVADRAEAARAILELRVHGRDHVIAAAAAEGIAAGELDALLRRQAKASLYLDRMVAPMLQPSEIELRDLYRSGATPFKDQPFDQISAALAKWYVGQRLSVAVEAYYQNARARVVVAVARKPKG